MLLEHLSICNYGVYAKKNDFELATTPEKPIVLIGGFNGAGKTTILESMMIALYGRAYLGAKRTKKEYLDFIHDRIHRSDKKRADSASIEVAFRFYHDGSENKYALSRSWDVHGASVTESFSVQKNGESMDDIDESQWQAFIEGLLPLGIAKLFFFDGEKIVSVTENRGRYNREIKESLETLIGADLVHRLRADLNLHILRNSGVKNDTLGKEYEEMNDEKDLLVRDIGMLREEREKKAAEIRDMNERIGAKESAISGIGGGYANMRDELLAQRAALEEKAKHQTRQIQEELSGDAVFHLVPSMLGRIGDQLKKDGEIMRRQAAGTSTATLLPEMRKRMSEPEFWSAGEDGKSISRKVLDMVAEIGAASKEDVFFDLSPKDAVFLNGTINRVEHGHMPVSVMTHALAKTTELLERARSDIARIPKDDELGPRITEINQMHQEIGILMGEATHLDQQIASKTAHRKILQSRLKGMIDSIHRGKRAVTGVQLASKMQDTLDTYYARLKERRMRELESNLLHTARLLMHKRSIHKIEIDRNSFEIRAYENDLDHIPGDFMSMGERQIVGTALLWAIARTCGRSLPFVIDTPLGRLDGRHLHNLTERFYPAASHQIILLSTDREIGQKEYGRLSGSISRSYKITCDGDRPVTSVSPGYFGGGETA